MKIPRSSCRTWIGLEECLGLLHDQVIVVARTARSAEATSLALPHSTPIAEASSGPSLVRELDTV